MTDARAIDRHAWEKQGQPVQVGEPVRLVLSSAQVEEVLRGVSGDAGGGLHEFLLTHAGRLEQLNTAGGQKKGKDPMLHLSLLRALAILRFLSLGDGEKSLYDIARGVEGTPSTTRRYLTTLKKIGLIDQSEETRAYRLAVAPKRKPRRARRGAYVSARVVLCDAQVQAVLRSVVQEGQGGLHGFLVSRTGLEQLGPLRDSELPDDPHISRSLLRALLIVRFLFLEGGVQPLIVIARGVGLSSSTTHRYLATLKQVRLVERIAAHGYRLATDAQA
jgi:DNA-binding transcriptional ArsR family regulator